MANKQNKAIKQTKQQNKTKQNKSKTYKLNIKTKMIRHKPRRHGQAKTVSKTKQHKNKNTNK